MRGRLPAILAGYGLLMPLVRFGGLRRIFVYEFTFGRTALYRA